MVYFQTLDPGSYGFNQVNILFWYNKGESFIKPAIASCVRSPRPPTCLVWTDHGAKVGVAYGVQWEGGGQ